MNVSPLQTMMKRSEELFLKEGVPDRHHEDWRYTNLKEKMGIYQDELRDALCYQNDFNSSFSANRLVIENGRLATCNSNLPKGCKLNVYKPSEFEIPKQILKRIEKSDPLYAHALSKNLEVIYLEVSGSSTLEILYTNEHENHFMRPLILIDITENSTLNLIENIEIKTDLFFHHTTDLLIGKNSAVTHLLFSKETKGIARSYIECNLLESASYNYFNISDGSALYRADIKTILKGKEAKASLYGLTKLKGSNHVDHFVTVVHEVGETDSDQLFKVVAQDESKGIFTGKIIVNKDAQKVNSTQLSKNLLLSKRAQIFTRPQLEIYADDVKCSHGATIGQMSDEELFYLVARGIEKERAYALLSHAFIQDVFDHIPNRELASSVSSRIFAGSTGSK